MPISSFTAVISRRIAWIFFLRILTRVSLASEGGSFDVKRWERGVDDTVRLRSFENIARCSVEEAWGQRVVGGPGKLLPWSADRLHFSGFEGLSALSGFETHGKRFRSLSNLAADLRTSLAKNLRIKSALGKVRTKDLLARNLQF